MSESNEQERSTHFLGFAKLLREEITKPIAGPHPAWFTSEQLDRLIAQRVYDLFIYDRMNTGTSDLQHAASRYQAELLVQGVPDMTAWPEQDKAE